MKKTGWALIAIAGFWGIQGCSTIRTLSSDDVEGMMYERPDSEPHSMPRVYSGVVDDARCVAGSEAGDIGAICLVDLPLSLCADTLVLPYTLYTQVRYGNYRPRFVPRVHDDEMRRREQWRRNLIDYCRRVGFRRSDEAGEFCRKKIQTDVEMRDGGEER